MTMASTKTLHSDFGCPLVEFFNKMARNAVKLEYIENDLTRRVTYKKRVKSMMKKTHELSVLCGVEACTIVYGPYDRAPMVCPSTEDEARQILSEFMQKPEFDQSKRQFNQQKFLEQKVIKAEERLEKLQRSKREMEIENLMVEILAGKPLVQVPYSNMRDLFWVIEDKMKRIQAKIDVLEGRYIPPSSLCDENNHANGDEMLSGTNEEMRKMTLPEMEENTSSSENGSSSG